MYDLKQFLDYSLITKKRLPKWGDREEVQYIDSEIYSLDDEELNQIASDLAQGKIYTDRNCQTPEEFMETFPVLAMVRWENSEAQQKWSDNVGLIFEYNEKALVLETDEDPPRLTRMFLSFRLLNKQDTDKVFKMLTFTKIPS